MVAIFLIGTFLFFVTLDYFTQRARKHATAPSAAGHKVALPDRFLVPRGFFFSPGHSWAEILPSGNVRVGVDDFLQKIVGNLDGLHVMKHKMHVERGEPMMILEQGERMLSVTAPVSGEIVAINDQVVQHPERVKEDPYATGWVLTINPSNLKEDLQLLKLGKETAAWLRAEVSRFRDFIRSCSAQHEFANLGVTMADGGIPLTGVMERADTSDWQLFEEQFLIAPLDISGNQSTPGQSR